MGEKTEQDLFPSCPLILDEASANYLSLFSKMYQLYYSLDKAEVIDNRYYDNYFIRFEIGKDAIVYPWLEFTAYEVVDLINHLHTLSAGVYQQAVSTTDFLKTLNFEVFWEQLEDWAEYLELKDFEEDGSPHIAYVFKMYKCAEHYFKIHGEYPKKFRNDIEKLMVDIDEYYALNVFKEEEAERKEISANDELDSGVIPLEEGMSNNHIPNTPPVTVTVPDPKDTEDKKDKKEKKKKEKERSIKANIVSLDFVENGIYEGRK